MFQCDIYIFYFVFTTNIPDSLQYLLIARPVRVFRELMKQLIRNIKLSFLFLILLYQAGCSPRIAVSGNLPNSDLLESIEIGQVNKQEVLNLLGTPQQFPLFQVMIGIMLANEQRHPLFLLQKLLIAKFC